MDGWQPPVPAGATVRWTPSWRLVTFGPAEQLTPRLYVAVGARDLALAYERMLPLLEAERLQHRHARRPEVLQAYETHPWWAGKAIMVEAASGLEGLATRVDRMLAGQGLIGPTSLAGARAFGGQSGLVFLAMDSGAPESDTRRQRLAQLLDL